MAEAKAVLEVYPAGSGGVTLHSFSVVNGWKDGDFYHTGMPGQPVDKWFKHVLYIRDLQEVTHFPLVEEKKVIEEKEAV